MPRTLLGVQIPTETRGQTVEKIVENVKKHDKFVHVVSLNPEILVAAQAQPSFKDVLNQAQIKLIDGIGVRMAAQVLGIPCGERFSGVNLMSEMVSRANGLRLKVALIGGSKDLAESLAVRYGQAHPEAKFVGIQGIKNIKNPEKSEENHIKSVIADLRPHIVFVSFGSPDQELWIDSRREFFKNSVVCGVGGAFDFLGGRVKRAPKLLQDIGLEWLYRLWVQPWRWKRQLRLISFGRMVATQLLWKKES